jgi:hypothetical protein
MSSAPRSPSARPYPAFRTDETGSWWLVTFNLALVKTDGSGGTDLGRVVLRVDHDGHVCRVKQIETDRRRSGLEPEIYSLCLPNSRKLIEL